MRKSRKPSTKLNGFSRCDDETANISRRPYRGRILQRVSYQRSRTGHFRRAELKIREIRAVRLRDGLNNRFVRVYTDQGLTGTGEFMDTLGAEYIINNNISPGLAGRDPLDIEGILSSLWQDRLPGGAPSAVSSGGMADPTSLPSAEWKWPSGTWPGKPWAFRYTACWEAGPQQSARLSACRRCGGRQEAHRRDQVQGS